jgi:hypothetical protein
MGWTPLAVTTSISLSPAFPRRPAPSGAMATPPLPTPIPSRVFNTEPTGHSLVQAMQVPAGEDITGFALTVEPSDGSPQPTTTAFLAGFLAAIK